MGHVINQTKNIKKQEHANKNKNNMTNNTPGTNDKINKMKKILLTIVAEDLVI